MERQKPKWWGKHICVVYVYSIYIYVYIFILFANRVISLKKAFLPPALQYSYSIFDLPEKKTRPFRRPRVTPPSSANVNSTLPALGAPAVFQSCHIAGPQHNSNSSTSTSRWAIGKQVDGSNGDRISGVGVSGSWDIQVGKNCIICAELGRFFHRSLTPTQALQYCWCLRNPANHPGCKKNRRK